MHFFNFKDKAEIIDELPLDYNTAVRKVVEEASPVKSFSMLSADTGLLYPFVSWRYLRGTKQF